MSNEAGSTTVSVRALSAQACNHKRGTEALYVAQLEARGSMREVDIQVHMVADESMKNDNEQRAHLFAHLQNQSVCSGAFTPVP